MPPFGIGNPPLEFLESLISHRIYFFTGRNEVLAKVIFSQASVILLTGGGVPDQAPPPLAGTPPPGRYPPSRQVHPPSRQVHPPSRQVPPQAGTPPSRQAPPQAGTPPPGRHPPPSRQVQPPPPETADPGIQSTIGRYASYWNAFLLLNVFIWKIALYSVIIKSTPLTITVYHKLSVNN